MVAMACIGIYTIKRLQLQIEACTEYSYMPKTKKKTHTTLVHANQSPCGRVLPVGLHDGYGDGWVSAVWSYGNWYRRLNCWLQFQHIGRLIWPGEHIEHICIDVVPVAPLLTRTSAVYSVPPVSAHIFVTAAIADSSSTSQFKWILCTNTLELQMWFDTSVWAQNTNPIGLLQSSSQSMYSWEWHASCEWCA